MASSRGQFESITKSRTTSDWTEKREIDRPQPHVYDIVCIGFGCKSISLAIALDETYHNANVLFLEGRSRSTYVPFNRLPGSFMQHSFLNDLVTLENPRSRFSFVNYLHSTDQLIQFTNLGSIQPLREHFARYLHWCVDQLDDKVQYSSSVNTVRPARLHGGLVDAWSVEYVNTSTGQVETVAAKQIVCAEEPQISMPNVFSNSDISTSVLHASHSSDLLSALSEDLTNQHHVTIIGNGQEAAEIVESVCSMRSSHRVTWLRTPSSETTGDIDQSLRHCLYERQYSQRVSQSDPQKWSLQIVPDANLESAYRGNDGRVRLSWTCSDTERRGGQIHCDFVIAATGYKKPAYKQSLKPVQEVLHEDRFAINKRGGVNLKTEMVERDCGIWLLESDKTQPDDGTLAQMATASRYLADSLVKKLRGHSASWERVQPRL